MYEFDVPNSVDKQGYGDDNEELVRQKLIISWPEVLVRTIGIILLLVGLWASIHVLLEALRLYRDPIKIEQLASAIERGSNLDKSLTQNFHNDAAENPDVGNAALLHSQQPGQSIRLSYFIAWIIALLILMLVVMIAFSCIRTGSELVLQDRQLKRYVQLLAAELGRHKDPDK